MNASKKIFKTLWHRPLVLWIAAPFGLAITTLAAICIVTTSMPLLADIIDDAKALMEAKQYEEAAHSLTAYLKAHPKDDATTPEALFHLGVALDHMSDIINTRAENECYRRKGSPKSAGCMKAFTAKLNKKYGEGSFHYLEQMVIIRYTGRHYDIVRTQYPKSHAASAADYHNLTKHVVGEPAEVLGRIKDFLKRHPGGEWGRKGWLLYARINEDIWWIHRNWWWLLYNWHYSEDDMIVRSEPYRQEALRTFEKIKKEHRGTSEQAAAKQEYKLLKKYQSDGILYGIVNESVIQNSAPPKKKK